MFKADSNNTTETLIGPSVHVKGDFKSQGNVQIDGQVTGTVQTNGTLKVGEQARLTANITAANAYIAGIIKGNVLVAERLELSSKAKIDGDISTKILVMAEGAQLNGRCQMGGSVLNEQAIKNKKDKAVNTPET